MDALTMQAKHAGVRLMQNYNENAYERYRRRAEVLKNCDVKKTGSFIENGEQSTEIVVDRTQETIPVAMIMSHKEGADELYVFCHNGADFQVLDYYTWTDNNENEHHYFVSEQVAIVKNVEYRKLKSFECNVWVNNNFWAYFKGPLRTSRDTGFHSHYEENKLLPILICPIREDVFVGQYVVIKDQTWRIVEADIYTIDGLGFYTMSRGMNDNNVDDIEQEDSSLIYVGQNIELPTYNGYYSSTSSAIQLISRSAKKIVVKIVGVSDSIIINTKDENGDIEMHLFESKENV